MERGDGSSYCRKRLVPYPPSAAHATIDASNLGPAQRRANAPTGAPFAMARSPIGIWILGARGGVAVTTMAGLIAQRSGLTDAVGLVSELPPFAGLDLRPWSDFVVGGHDIRTASLNDELSRLHRESRVLSAELLASCRDDLAEIEQRLRPGVLWNVGSRIAELADASIAQHAFAREAVEQIKADLEEFRDAHDLSDVVVVNLASTEAMPRDRAWPESAESVLAAIDQRDCPLPASSLYALGALDLGFGYINFTPSLGACVPGIDDLATARQTCHAGCDGKTGETLLKSVLAPMFAARNLEVMSWVGHNIFGNLDGKVLDDPENKRSKVESKDHLLGDILGEPPQTLVTIEHIASLCDWKTAWDHIHFRGFLGTPMTLQFTWQGCDSLLAAPLVLDLVRFTCAARARGETGALTFLSSFFKSPLGGGDPSFAAQFDALKQWAAADA